MKNSKKVVICLSVASVFFRIMILICGIAAYSQISKVESADVAGTDCFYIFRDLPEAVDFKFEKKIYDLGKIMEIKIGPQEKNCLDLDPNDATQEFKRGESSLMGWAVWGLIVYVLSTGVKSIYLYVESKEIAIHPPNLNFCQQGFLYGMEYWLLTMLPGICLEPLTAMRTYALDEYPGLAILQLTNYWYVSSIASFWAYACQICFGGARQCARCEACGDGKSFLKYLLSMWLIPFFAFIVWAGNVISNLSLPGFNFALLFQFNFSFGIAILVDFIQVMTFLMAVVDGIAKLLSCAKKS